MRILILQLLMALMALQTPRLVRAQSDEDFQCGSPETIDEWKPEGSNQVGFDTIDIEYSFSGPNDRNFLMPSVMNWHIYALPEGETTPRFACHPAGLLEPYVSGKVVKFKAGISNVLRDLGYSKGDSVEAAVVFYVPFDQLQNIYVTGVHHVVEVIARDNVTTNSTRSLFVSSSGVGTQIYVDTPYHQVEFRGEGVDNIANIISASGARIAIEGVNPSVSLKADLLSSARMEGVNPSLLFEGDTFDSISTSGIGGSVRLNGPTAGCSKVYQDGINNQCTTTTKNVTIPTMECLATSKVVKASEVGCNGYLSAGAWIGISFGILFIIASCIGLCAFCCGCCRRKREYPSPKEYPTLNKTAVPSFGTVPTNSQPAPSSKVVEAEVLEIESSGDAQRQYAQENVDPEQALGKDEPQLAPYVASKDTEKVQATTY